MITAMNTTASSKPIHPLGAAPVPGLASPAMLYGKTTLVSESMATMFITLTIGLMAGPAVSFSGSPTVSPVTAALCFSEPLPRLR